MVHIPTALAARLHSQAEAERWGVAIDTFTEALETSARKAGATDAGTLGRYLGALHLQDLALACACAHGHEAAWEHFVREFRPALYRAASAIDPAGGRELADSLYAELFGLKERDGERQSLFRYFHGRSSLGTWLRAVMAQRHVDGVRAGRRLEPLPEEDTPGAPGSVDTAVEDRPEAHRFVATLQLALSAAVGRLAPRDRLRLGWYYAQEMTLAEIGRVLSEHEATVSRHLSRTRKALRADVEKQLTAQGMGPREIDECFAAAADDPGTLDLATLLGTEAPRKNARLDRSGSEGIK
ncbi:MAG: sigma-70 family RNA polymerase sigma factor [Acidobacteriota bacterium]|nr:sigma-70 family RNA polymerase sigma factor [Acidobacteriota bacterium]